MKIENSKAITLLADPFLKESGVNIYVKRDDLIHPVSGGNKFRKLKYNLEKAKAENKNTLVTFGGAFSNHIAATAFAGKEYGFKTIGIIRGEKTEPLNITLKRAMQCGMELMYVDRKTYRDKNLAVNAALKDRDQKTFYLIPEGGSNYEGFKGCCEITGEIDFDPIAIGFDYICCPCGTGTTLAGLAATLKEHQHAIGFSVLKNNLSLNTSVKNLLTQYKPAVLISNFKFQISSDYHFGGYAKTTPELNAFVKRFNEINNIEIEPVYTGKMFFGIYDLVKKGFFKKGDVVVALHTGGLQCMKEFEIVSKNKDST